MSWVQVAYGTMRDTLMTVCRALNIAHKVAPDDQPKMLLVQSADVPLINLMGRLLEEHIATTNERLYVAALTERLKDPVYATALMSAYMIGGLEGAMPMLEDFLKPTVKGADE